MSTASHGYTQIGWQNGGERRIILGHRLAYVIFCGNIPADQTVDHLCKNPLCVNPAHLRLLTNVENARDNRQAQRGKGRRSYKEVVA